MPHAREFSVFLASLIALRTNFRHFRVEEHAEHSAIVKISGNDLLGDLYRGELCGLVLEGINAPEPSPA